MINGESERKIELLSGDITLIEADAIVCPTLPDMDVLYTGVAGAIFRRGGERIFMEAREIGRKLKEDYPERGRFPAPLYSAHRTNPGILPHAKHVIHTVSIGFDDTRGLYCDPQVVYESSLNVLELAKELEIASVAFPALGSGLYDVEVEDSLDAIARAGVQHWERNRDSSVNVLKLVTLDPSIIQPSIIDQILTDFRARSMRPSRTRSDNAKLTAEQEKERELVASR